MIAVQGVGCLIIFMLISAESSISGDLLGFPAAYLKLCSGIHYPLSPSNNLRFR